MTAMTDQEITNLRWMVGRDFFKFVDSVKKNHPAINDEFIAFTLLTYCGAFLGGSISREDAQRAFDMAFEMGEKITHGFRGNGDHFSL